MLPLWLKSFNQVSKEMDHGQPLLSNRHFDWKLQDLKCCFLLQRCVSFSLLKLWRCWGFWERDCNLGHYPAVTCVRFLQDKHPHCLPMLMCKSSISILDYTLCAEMNQQGTPLSLCTVLSVVFRLCSSWIGWTHMTRRRSWNMSPRPVPSDKANKHIHSVLICPPAAFCKVPSHTDPACIQFLRVSAVSDVTLNNAGTGSHWQPNPELPGFCRSNGTKMVATASWGSQATTGGSSGEGDICLLLGGESPGSRNGVPWLTAGYFAVWIEQSCDGPPEPPPGIGSSCGSYCWATLSPSRFLPTFPAPTGLPAAKPAGAPAVPSSHVGTQHYLSALWHVGHIFIGSTRVTLAVGPSGLGPRTESKIN